jgi:hypothetical protein
MEADADGLMALMFEEDDSGGGDDAKADVNDGCRMMIEATRCNSVNGCIRNDQRRRLAGWLAGKDTSV